MLLTSWNNIYLLAVVIAAFHRFSRTRFVPRICLWWVFYVLVKLLNAPAEIEVYFKLRIEWAKERHNSSSSNLTNIHVYLMETNRNVRWLLYIFSWYFVVSAIVSVQNRPKCNLLFCRHHCCIRNVEVSYIFGDYLYANRCSQVVIWIEKK